MANTAGEDRAWVAQSFRTLLGRPPTETELNAWTAVLQQGAGGPGYTREDIERSIMRNNATEYTNRMFKQNLGRDPRPDEMQHWQEYLAKQEATHAQLLQAVSETPEVLTRDPSKLKDPGAEAENAKAILNGALANYGLSNMSDWAWQQLQDGHSIDRIMVDLRQTNEYKARFPAMDQRRAQGLAPLSEAQYIEFESQARSIMRANGMPPGFWDSPSDYTSLIANDISPQELQTRVEQGWKRVAQAPPEVRQAFSNYFGAEGDTALAAWFVDPGKAESLILEATEQARIGGYASLFDLNISKGRAKELTDFGISSDKAIEAYSRVAQAAPLFTESVSENEDLVAEDQGLNAALGMDATSAAALERRGRTRFAATAGGGGAAVSSRGVAAGAAE